MNRKKRKRIVQTTLTKPAQLRFYHPAGTSVSLADKLIEQDTGRQTWFIAPKVDGMYLNRAEDLINLALPKRVAVFSSRKPVNPKDLTMGDGFTDEDSLLDFFELASAAIILLYASIEYVANLYIEQAKHVLYKRKKYTTLFKLGKIRLQIKKEIILPKEDILYLSLGEKLKAVLPIHYSFESPATKVFWKEFLILKGLRDELVHISRHRSYGASRGENSVYAKLLEIDLRGLFNNNKSLIEYVEEECKKVPQT